MHPNEAALIKRLSNATSLSTSLGYKATWTLHQPDPLDLRKDCPILSIQWIDHNDQAFSTTIDRAGIEAGRFLPSLTFVCNDTKGTETVLAVDIELESTRTLDAYLHQPMYHKRAFSPDLLEIDLCSVLGHRLAFILDPSRIYASPEEEWDSLALQAIRSAHAVFRNADPAEKTALFDFDSVHRYDTTSKSLIEDIRRLLAGFEDACVEYTAAPSNHPNTEDLYQRMHTSRDDLLAVVSTTITRLAPVTWAGFQRPPTRDPFLR